LQNPFHHLARGILIKDDKVLLAQARGNANTFLPGGHIEFGESAKDALKREIGGQGDGSCGSVCPQGQTVRAALLII
jgi:hypothetical protein